MSRLEVTEWICDRCGQLRQYPRSQGLPPGWVRLLKQRFSNSQPSHTSHYADLCSRCVVQVEHVVHNPESD